MAADLEFLEEAISDVGLWTWWTAELPETIQIEFSGVLLWNAPLKADGPPNGQIALRFLNPSFVGFLTRRVPDLTVPQEWPKRFQEDQLEPFNLSSDDFTLSDATRFPAMTANASHIETLVGDAASLTNVAPEAGVLGFWAGPVGLVIVAESMKIYSYAGQQSLAEAEEANRKWWNYWREYWQRKDSRNPMPKDYACEVTIPL